MLHSKRKRRDDDARRLAALQVDGEVLETLEEMLCEKRKGFRAVQREIDGLGDFSDVRESVRRAIGIYRRGQGAILDQAIQWTRAKMDELVDLIEDLEDRMGDAGAGAEVEA